MNILIISLLILVFILTYIIFNLLRKNEKCEDIIKSYENYMVNFSSIIDFSQKKLNEIDSKGSFESDDEVGFFFKSIKHIQEELNNFRITL
jgi:competence protein ComGC